MLRLPAAQQRALREELARLHDAHDEDEDAHMRTMQERVIVEKLMFLKIYHLNPEQAHHILSRIEI